MPPSWEEYLQRWVDAGLLDPATAGRIRTFEDAQAPVAGAATSTAWRWPTLLAVSLGALLLAAGILLFVAAHWDELGPAARFSLVLLLLVGFHAGGAMAAGKFESLAIALHTLGTAALGAAIALTGQIFNLSEHWPSGVLLWAIGALAAWAALRHWPQGTLAALLVPAWLISEWVDYDSVDYRPIAAGVCLLAFAYLSARTASDDGPFRRSLVWIGGLAIIPAALLLVGESVVSKPINLHALLLAFLLPSLIAVALRGRSAWMNLIAVAWAAGALASNSDSLGLTQFLWWASGSVGVAVWGIADGCAERVNLGVAGFALTVLGFYFSDVLDKLDRAAGLAGLGILFLLGGWALEKTRRRLIAGIGPRGKAV